MTKTDREKCVGCGGCIDLCPPAAIRMVKDRASVDAERCIECGTCVHVCPLQAVEEV